jgi:hypothetical protein
LEFKDSPKLATIADFCKLTATIDMDAFTSKGEVPHAGRTTEAQEAPQEEGSKRQRRA